MKLIYNINTNILIKLLVSMSNHKHNDFIHAYSFNLSHILSKSKSEYISLFFTS